MQYARFADFEDIVGEDEDEPEMPEDLRQEIFDVAMEVSQQYLKYMEGRAPPSGVADASWQQQVTDEMVWSWIQAKVPDLDLPDADDMIDDLEAIGWIRLPWS
jgi:hypothetical protein